MTKHVNRQSPIGHCAVVAMLVLGLGGCDAPVESAESQAALSGHAPANPNPALYESDARPLGVSMLAWSEDWLRWMYSIPLATNPTIDPTQSCDQNQDAPVFFLPNNNPGAPTCYVPRDKPIAVPLLVIMNDYPCSSDPSFQPAPGQSLYDFLMEGLVLPVDSINATLDGKPLQDLLSYHYISNRLFDFVGDMTLQPTFDTCVTGKPQPAVSDSYFIMLKPLPPGPHVFSETMIDPNGPALTSVSFTVR